MKNFGGAIQKTHNYVFTTTLPKDYKFDIYGNIITKDGTYIIPVTDVVIEYDNPYYKFNADAGYIRNVIQHVYYRLINFWLYEYKSYDKLIKYFNIDLKDGRGSITLVKTLSDAVDSELKDKYKKYILQHIENNYVNEKFVATILKKYVKKHMIQWYDLILNEKSLIKLFHKKLKRKIEKLIIGIEKKKTNFKL